MARLRFLGVGDASFSISAGRNLSRIVSNFSSVEADAIRSSRLDINVYSLSESGGGFDDDILKEGSSAAGASG